MPQLILASLLWSVSFALIGKSGIDPDLLAAARLGLAALVFAPLLVRARSTRLAWPLALVGALQFGVMYVLVLRSYAYLEGHEVALLTITTPILVVLVEGLVRRRLVVRALCAAGVATAAAVVLRDGAAALGGGEGVDRSFVVGLLLVQGANLAWAAGQLAYRRVERGEGADESTASQRFGWLYLGAFVVALGWAVPNVASSDLRLDAQQIATVAYLGVVPSGLAFWLWNRGATRVSVGVLAVMNNLKIPLAVAVALLPPFSEPYESGPLATSAVLFVVALLIAAWPGAAAERGNGAQPAS